MFVIEFFVDFLNMITFRWMIYLSFENVNSIKQWALLKLNIAFKGKREYAGKEAFSLIF